MEKPYKKIKEEVIINSKWLTVTCARMEMVSGRVLPSYYFINNRDIVCVLALTDDQQVVCIEQFRLGIDCYYLQFVTGYIDEGEAPEEAARRELLEETSYEVGELISLGKLHANPSRSSYFLHFFLAKDAKKVEYTGEIDDTEVLVPRLIPLSELQMGKRNDAFCDLTSVSCLALAQKHLPQL